MKKAVFLLTIIGFFGISLFAQKSQVGYVRTVQKSGRPAQYLAGAHITTLESVNEATSQAGGYFEIPVKSANGKNGYTITDVSLFGYNLIDEGKLNRRQTYSLSPIEIVLISKEEENRQRQFLENKIRAVIKENYETKLEELQDQYDAIMQLNLQYADQLNNLDALVTKIVYLDYKNINDSLDIQIAEAYEQGDFLRACELIDQKPSFSDRLSAYKSKKEAIRRLSESAEIEKETVIRECDIKIAYYKSKWQYDSVLYFVDIKLELEPENGEFLLEKAWFLESQAIHGFFGNDFDNDPIYWEIEDLSRKDSVTLYYAKLAEAKLSEDNNPKIESCYMLLAQLANNYSDRLLYHKKRLEILEKENKTDSITLHEIFSAIHHIILNFNNLSLYDSAIQYASKYFLMEGDTSMYFEEDILESVARSYSGIGDYNQALEYYRKALDYSLSGYESIIYYDMATLFEKNKQFDSAIVYAQKAVSISDEFWSNLYFDMGEYDSSLFYCEKQLPTIKERAAKSDEILNDNRNVIKEISRFKRDKEAALISPKRTLFVILNRMASIYYRKGLYEKALQAYQEALNYVFCDKSSIFYNDFSITQAKIYSGMADVYSELNNYPSALENYSKALSIYEAEKGKKSPEALEVKQAIKECKKKMKGKK